MSPSKSLSALTVHKVLRELYRLSRIIALAGLLGLIGIFLYSAIFGGAAILRPIGYVAVSLWLGGMIIFFALKWFAISQAIRTMKSTKKRSPLIWLALFFCFAPAPLLYLLYKTLGRAPDTQMNLYMFASFASLIIGFGLLGYLFLGLLRDLQALAKYQKQQNTNRA